MNWLRFCDTDSLDCLCVIHERSSDSHWRRDGPNEHEDDRRGLGAGGRVVSSVSAPAGGARGVMTGCSWKPCIISPRTTSHGVRCRNASAAGTASTLSPALQSWCVRGLLRTADGRQRLGASCADVRFFSVCAHVPAAGARGAGKPGAGPLAGRVLHENPPEVRSSGAAPRPFCSAAGRKATQPISSLCSKRHWRPCREPSWATRGMTARQPRSRAPARHCAGHPATENGENPGGTLSRGPLLSGTGAHRAIDRQDQAVQENRPALRENRNALLLFSCPRVRIHLDQIRPQGLICAKSAATLRKVCDPATPRMPPCWG